MTRTRSLACALALVGAALATLPTDAEACGGCFNPPPVTGTPTPVNGHRMAVAISPRGTTLWDQIQYAGAPEDFVWVLPVVGSPMVELADNGFFEALTGATTIRMTSPLPPRTSCSDPCGGALFGFASSASSPSLARGSEDGTPPPVTVSYEGVVGPYETATISSTDPGALVGWLNDHGYQVPPSIEPTIEHYVAMGSSFVALRLSPGEGVDRMQPVRVTSPGLSLTFPLRMVAAGVQTAVDLELFVFAEGRMEAENFSNAEVDRAAITFDWTSRTFSYDAEFENALFSGEGTSTNWVTEFAGPADLLAIRSFTTSDPVTGDVHSPDVDLGVVTDAIDVPYLTRMRTRLPPSELNRDLVLRSSAGGDVEADFLVTRELNRAPEPTCPTICSEGTGLGPGGTDRGTGGAARCSVGFARASASLPLLGLALGLAAIRRGRRR